MLLCIVGCGETKSLLKVKDPKGVDSSINICTTDIKAFVFSEEELLSMSRSNKENALQVNCTLHKCGYSVPNPDLCDSLF